MMKFQRLILIIFVFSSLAGCVFVESATSTPIPYASLVPQPTSVVTVLPAENRPNIILILTDDLDSKLGTIDYMPNLQSLMIQKGLSFKDFFITTPTCCPSRTTFLRGQYTHNHQIYTSSAIEGFQKFYLSGYDSSTIATWLNSAGYETIFMGKYLNGYPIRLDRAYVPQGWDEWFSPARGKPYDGFNYTLNVNGTLVPYGENPEDYLVDVLTGEMNTFLHDSGRSSSPFFMFISPYQPHQPAIPAPRHAELFPGLQAPRTPSFNEDVIWDKPDDMKYDPPLTSEQIQDLDYLYRLRVQSMQSVDEMIAELFIALNETDQLENTYIIFTSDNGFHLGQHRMIAGKDSPYEEDINVPFVIVGPGIPSNVIREDYLVGNVDIAPTIADLAGIIPPDIIDGRSLVPLFDLNKEIVADWRKSYLLEFYNESKGVEANAFQTIAYDDSSGILEPPDLDDLVQSTVTPSYKGLRTAQYLYVEYANGFIELYDLRKDPFELENIVSSADPELLSTLSQWLKELSTCKTDTCKEIESRNLP